MHIGNNYMFTNDYKLVCHPYMEEIRQTDVYKRISN